MSQTKFQSENQKSTLEILDIDCNLFQYILTSCFIYFWLLQHTWSLKLRCQLHEKEIFKVLCVIIFIYIFYIAWWWLLGRTKTFCNITYSKIYKHSCDCHFSVVIEWDDNIKISRVINFRVSKGVGNFVISWVTVSI